MEEKSEADGQQRTYDIQIDEEGEGVVASEHVYSVRVYVCVDIIV